MGSLNQISRSVPHIPYLTTVPELVSHISELEDSEKINELIETVRSLVETVNKYKEVIDSLIKRGAESSDHSEQVVELWNKGRLQLREFTARPVLADMAVKEISYGVATGTGSANEYFIKVSTTVISRFTESGQI